MTLLVPLVCAHIFEFYHLFCYSLLKIHFCLLYYPVFQALPVTVEEPESNSVEVTLPVVRKAGTIGTVAVQWKATVNGQLAEGDIRPTSGEVKFAPGETMKTIKVEILADDIPEITEVRK